MSNYSRKIKAALIISLTALTQLSGATEKPEGLMLNLDFESTADGLIPNKTLYPLYVPLEKLNIEKVKNRNMLAIEYGQGLNIPHSSLLDPDGHEWVVSVRFFALTQGLIASQTNDKHGYAIYAKDGKIHAAIKSGRTTFVLTEKYQPTKATKQWITVVLRIKPDIVTMNLNRKRAALIHLPAPLDGQNMHIRLGHHKTPPAPFKHLQDFPADGFTGAISSFKILRQ